VTARLTSAMLVSALVRRVQNAGGAAAILSKGEEQAGAIILLCAERGVAEQLLERILDIGGRYRWTRCGPESPDEFDQYLERRRSRDPDIWVVELDIAHAERFAAETIASD
jgi:hypothetical protein